MARDTQNTGTGRHRRAKAGEKLVARPLPKAGGGTTTGNVLTLAPPPLLDPLGRLGRPLPFERGELLDPLAEARRRSAAAVAGVLTGAIALPPMLGLSPAVAAIDPKPNPTPAVTLPAGIEALAPYVGQNSCDPVPKPGVVAFSRLVLSYWGRGGTYGISRACGVGGQSEHKEGRAWDFKLDPDDYEDQVTGQRVTDWLLADDAANARRLGIMYFIWNERIWSAYQREDGWRPYHGPDNHTSHIHFSFSWAGAMKRTSWWTGTVAPAEFGPCQKYVGQKVPVYGTTINLSPCPKPIAKPKLNPRPTENSGDSQAETRGGGKKGDDKNSKRTTDKPVAKPGPRGGQNHDNPAPKPAFKVVRVKSGQTIGSIATRNHTSVRRIVKLNHLKSPHRIFVGQRLRVPVAGAEADRAKVERAIRIVTVKPGDTLGGLAIRYDTTVPAMVKANNLKSADHIYPGQRLRLI